MRLEVDMGIPPRVVEELRQTGHDAIHLAEQGLNLTADGGELPSVIIFRLRDMRSPNVSRHLNSILNQPSEALAEGAVLSVTEQKVRIRRLPIK